jgi:steroid delta-isomerase-like uncharacterized protein
MANQYDTIQHHWFEEVWNKGRAEVIDELLDPDVIAHGLVDRAGNEVRGAADFKAFYESFRGAFPDIRVTVEDTVSEGDKIVARCRVQATHSGDSLGFSATNKPVEFSGMCMLRVKDGKIVEAWNSFDFLTMFQQMEVLNFPSK